MHMKFIKTALAMTLSSLLLNGCGGGASTSTSSINPTEPVKITASSWKKTLSKANKTITISSAIGYNIRRVPSSFYFTINGFDSAEMSKKHWQIHLDIDNDPQTGFQYKDEAWSQQSGIDYLIEDGYLYKATDNNSDWNWKFERKLKASEMSNKLEVDIPLPSSYVNTLCNDFNIGYIALDQDWSIDTFYPAANKMQKQSVKLCKNPPKNTAPVITLKGKQDMVIEQGSKFVELGATAYDKEDGDLTNDIKRIQGHSVDTSKLGNQSIRYYVTDSSGLNGYITRRVTVVKKAQIIKIDGQYNDWDTVASYVQTADGYMKITDDKENVYIMIETTKASKNWQILLNTDRIIPDPGYAYLTSGADFLIENGDFAKFSGKNKKHWAWNFNIQQAAIISKQARTLELMIPKNTFTKYGDRNSGSIHIAFVGLDDNWQDTAKLNSRYFSYTPLLNN